MPWISLPKELALPHLLDHQGVQAPLRDRLTQLAVQFTEDDPESLVTVAEDCYHMAKRGFDRYGQALALALEAEAYRRLSQWEDGLGMLRHALRWIELQVAPPARYNEALIVYLEGVMHFTLQSGERVAQTFAYARHLLAESELYWGREGHTGRVADCRNLVRWMSQLLDLYEMPTSHSQMAVLPVYEFVNRALIRTDALAVKASTVSVPAKVLVPYLRTGPDLPYHDAVGAAHDLPGVATPSVDPGSGVPVIWPIHSVVLPFPYLDPARTYIAVRAPVDEFLLVQGKRGDLLIIEVTGVHTADAAALPADVPFVRHEDGRIEIGSWSMAVQEPRWPAGAGVVGLPRLLVKEGESR
jgi:hypothetical protein